VKGSDKMYKHTKYAAFLDIHCPESGEVISVQAGLSKEGEPQIHTMQRAQEKVMRKAANRLIARKSWIDIDKWKQLASQGVRTIELPEYADAKDWAYGLIERSAHWTVIDNVSHGDFVFQVQPDAESIRPKSIMDLGDDEGVGE
tara:strand:- start:104 stop:535 length:432 start_codon:yes stop_codon:yes gene_type:complete